MKRYNIFNGEIFPHLIGKKLREIARLEKSSFVIVTSYGSTSGRSQSKVKALSSLRAMKKEGLISGYFPGEVKTTILKENSSYYHDKIKYESIVKNDKDYGNDGVIFIFK